MPQPGDGTTVAAGGPVAALREQQYRVVGPHAPGELSQPLWRLALAAPDEAGRQPAEEYIEAGIPAQRFLQHDGWPTPVPRKQEVYQRE